MRRANYCLLLKANALATLGAGGYRGEAVARSIVYKVVAAYQIVAAAMLLYAAVAALSLAQVSVAVIFGALSALFAASGIGLFIGRRWANILTTCLFAAQVPIITSPFTYHFTTMIYGDVIFDLMKGEMSFGGRISLASEFSLQVGSAYETLTVGINFFALVVAIILPEGKEEKPEAVTATAATSAGPVDDAGGRG